MIISSLIQAMAYSHYSSPHTLCFQLNTSCTILSYSSPYTLCFEFSMSCSILNHKSPYTVSTSLQAVEHSITTSDVLFAFSSTQGVAHSTTILHTLSASTFRYTTNSILFGLPTLLHPSCLLKTNFLPTFATPIPKIE